MAFGRPPGPLGKHTPAIDSGTLARTHNQKPGAVGADAAGAGKAADTPDIAKAKLEVIADITQFILDLTGIVDPTPISDGLSGLISLARGQWLDAGISVISFIPYIGDLAKTAKLPRYLSAVRKAVKIAKVDPVWGRRLKELFEKLKQGLDKAYKELADQLPESAKRQLKEIMDEVDDFLKPKGAPAAPKGGAGSASGGPSGRPKKAVDERAQGNYGEAGKKVDPKTTRPKPEAKPESKTKTDGPENTEKTQSAAERAEEIKRLRGKSHDFGETFNVADLKDTKTGKTRRVVTSNLENQTAPRNIDLKPNEEYIHPGPHIVRRPVKGPDGKILKDADGKIVRENFERVEVDGKAKYKPYDKKTNSAHHAEQRLKRAQKPVEEIVESAPTRKMCDDCKEVFGDDLSKVPDNLK